MEDGYWGLFWQTGAPEFYLLRKHKDGGPDGQQDEQHVRGVI